MSYLVCPFCGSYEYNNIYDENEDQDCFKCNDCDMFFIEPQEDYEYNEKMRENAAEARWEEKEGK